MVGRGKKKEKMSELVEVDVVRFSGINWNGENMYIIDDAGSKRSILESGFYEFKK